MQKSIRFFKLDNNEWKGWFADVLNHDLEDNEMVAGADVVLEEIDRVNGGRGEVFMTVSDVLAVNDASSPEPFLAKFVMKNHDDLGAEYILTGPLARRYDAEGFEVWICNVTHDVLGEHPRSIYVLDIY